MNQKQYEKEIDKAESQFKEIVGACYVFLRNNNPDLSENLIVEKLQYGVAKVIEEIREMERVNWANT